MEQNNMKEMSAAVNARLFLLFLGIMLMVNALTVSLRNGTGYLKFSGIMEKMVSEGTYSPAETESLTEAAAETSTENTTEVPAEAQMPQTDEEVAQQLLRGGVDYRDLRLMGILCMIQMIAELVVGFICAILANRVDKSKITVFATAALICVEAIVLTVQFTMGAMRLSSLLYSIIMPLVLLWAANKLRQLAKADPERVYAVLPRDKQRPSGQSGNNQGSASRTPSGPASSQTSAGSAVSGSGKSLRDRAMMHVDEDEENREAEPDAEESDAGEPEPEEIDVEAPDEEKIETEDSEE